MSFSKSISLMVLVIGMWSIMAVPGQVVTPPGNAPASRLEQLETTYYELLRNTQQPLLKQYLTDLQGLQTTALVAAESTALQAEIARIQGILAGKGFVEIGVPGQASSPTATVVHKSGIIFTLEPKDAAPPPPNAASADATVPLGTATWRLSTLPAGTYDVVAHYACPTIPAGAKLHVSFAHQEFDRELTPALATKDEKTFRVMRLCQFTLKEETRLQDLVVTAPPPGQPWIFVKQVLVVNSKGG